MILDTQRVILRIVDRLIKICKKYHILVLIVAKFTLRGLVVDELVQRVVIVLKHNGDISFRFKMPEK